MLVFFSFEIANSFSSWLMVFCIEAYFSFPDFLIFSYFASIDSSYCWAFSLPARSYWLYYYFNFLNLSYCIIWMLDICLSLSSIFILRYSFSWDKRAVFFSNYTLYYINFVLISFLALFSFSFSASIFYLIVNNSNLSSSTFFSLICNSFYNCYLEWFNPDLYFSILLCFVSNYSILA